MPISSPSRARVLRAVRVARAHLARRPRPGALALLPVAMVPFVMALLAACGSSARAPRLPATPTATPRPAVVYVALGASDALGVGADDPYTQGYVPRLIARLPAGSRALNLGVSGIELHQALTTELPQALVARPTLITIWLVANDFKDCVPLARYQADLATLLSQLTTRTHAQIFMANLPDMSQLPVIKQRSTLLGPCLANASTSQIQADEAQWNAAIASVATRYNVTLVNLAPYDIASHPDYIGPDGFHPSSAGYARLAQLFWAAITAHHAVAGS